ncbi:hypothetical protein ACWNT8_14180 [Pigmentibacter ruber]
MKKYIKHKNKMLDHKDFEEAKKFLAEFSPEVTSFESDILTPELIGRLNYIKTVFIEFKKICSDKTVADDMDKFVRELYNPSFYRQDDINNMKVGENYLKFISQQIDSQFINKIDNLLSKGSNLKNDFKEYSHFYLEIYHLMHIFIGTENTLFQYSLRVPTIITETITGIGKPQLGPPVNYSLILMPFKTSLEELVSIAKSSIESIKSWKKRIETEKEERTKIVVHISQLKASLKQAQATKLNMWFQILVIIFAICMSFFAYYFNMFLEKRDLQKNFEKIELELKSCKELNKESYFHFERSH